MAKLVDAVDSKSTAFGCAGSSPALGTTKKISKKRPPIKRRFFVIAVFSLFNNYSSIKERTMITLIFLLILAIGFGLIAAPLAISLRSFYICWWLALFCGYQKSKSSLLSLHLLYCYWLHIITQIHQSKNIINWQQTNTLFILFNGVVNLSIVPNKIVKLSLPIVLSGFGWCTSGKTS